jgi:threonine dehydratase
MTDSDLTLQDVFLARQTIQPFVRRTPLIMAQKLSEIFGANVYLKLETLQETGSFKIRGATNRILNLTPEEKSRGVVTVSTGNHGRAVAHAAKQAGVRATICISHRVPQNKVEALKLTGAEVVIHGQSQDEAETLAKSLVVERGLTMAHPFDDPFVIAGQGTIGLELLHDCPQIDMALVPLSGGGLISGVALALKSANPRIRVIGVSMECAPVMYKSLQAGRPVELPEQDTLADSLLGGIGLENRYTYAMVQKLVDDVVLVSEEAIAEAMAFVMREHRLIIEGAGAVGVAALIHKKINSDAHNVAVILSGGNVDSKLAAQIAQKIERS